MEKQLLSIEKLLVAAFLYFTANNFEVNIEITSRFVAILALVGWVFKLALYGIAGLAILVYAEDWYNRIKEKQEANNGSKLLKEDEGTIKL